MVDVGTRAAQRSCTDAERAGLRKSRRAEPAPRLAQLERLVAEQVARVRFMHEMGYSAALAEERLNVLENARQHHLSDVREPLPRQRGGAAPIGCARRSNVS